MGDRIDHSVGVEMLAKIGDEVQKDQPLAKIFCAESVAGLASELVGASFGITPTKADRPKLIVERVRI